MIEKVNPKHPDKIADRIAGAIVDLAYKKSKNPKVAVEVLIGHDQCNIIIESSENFEFCQIERIVQRIAGTVLVRPTIVKQDEHLANNQSDRIRCGDNGIFKGVPLTEEEKNMSEIARALYSTCQSDGKYILTDDRLIICQSNVDTEYVKQGYETLASCYGINKVIVNPLGDWTGGINVDSGATNRKLGSDMAQSVTGGGLHGKDLSKADVSINIFAFLKAQEIGKTVEICCAIGDDTIGYKTEDGIELIPYEQIVGIAREYIDNIGGFEKFAEWGLY